MKIEDQFEMFWSKYPRRVAKGTARTAFAKAVKKTDLETMLIALAEYKAKKPDRIDFKHPATWLNGECWHDEWENPRTETDSEKYQRQCKEAVRSGNGYDEFTSGPAFDLERSDYRTH